MEHEPFSLIINIENNSGAAKHATIRVFLGPKYDELGNRLKPDAQRRLMIELDKFHRECEYDLETCAVINSDIREILDSHSPV